MDCFDLNDYWEIQEMAGMMQKGYCLLCNERFTAEEVVANAGYCNECMEKIRKFEEEYDG